MVQVAVVGGGPTGLEAALAARERGRGVTVIEAAPQVAGYMRRWGQVRMFTPWSMNVSPTSGRLLGLPSPSVCPTGAEYAGHLDQLAGLLPDVQLGTRVEEIARQGLLKHEEIGSDMRRTTPVQPLITYLGGGEARRPRMWSWTAPAPTVIRTRAAMAVSRP